MQTYEKEIKELLSTLHDSNLLSHLIIIGSWAEDFYKDIIVDYIPNIRTLDIDFFYPRTNRPLNKVNLIQDLKRKGYIYDEDYITKKSKFYKGNGFEIEFLTKRDRSQEPIRKIQSIDVNAECLNLLDILEYHVIVIHSHLGIDIRVPKPEAYIIHKILIHDSRSIHKKREGFKGN